MIYQLALLVLSQIAAGNATPEDLREDKLLAAPPADAPADGWKNNLSVGANGSMTRSTNVVGTVDGTSAQLGVIIEGGATLVHGQNTWENGVKLTESFTRTPTVASFLKSADELRLQSTFLHRFKEIPWLGPYGRVLGTTSIFRGWSVPGEDVVIIRNNTDGTSITTTKVAQERYSLTKPFEPTVLRESAGMFATPITKDIFTLKTRLGAAMQHILTREGYALSDDSSTDAIEYKQLQDSTQAGAELDIETLGKIQDNITYSARAGFFYPIFESNDSPNSGLGNMQTDIAAKLSVHLSKYLSVDYVLQLKRIPLIVDEWQVQNGILLSAAFTVI